ncbi:hypothetical protein PR048_003358 [Dryococelus australis]|uniref:Uncharacterized protein n=1 Tax=Dryococelus australis TaxID=614101 RepID=A0ABQ9IPW0_9NEOP|nr:hypothetical protein PR048_003358 [Dryococelus australis]
MKARHDIEEFNILATPVGFFSRIGKGGGCDVSQFRRCQLFTGFTEGTPQGSERVVPGREEDRDGSPPTAPDSLPVPSATLAAHHIATCRNSCASKSLSQTRAEHARPGTSNMEVWRSAGVKGRGKRDIPEKTRRPAAPSGTIPKCENPRVTRPEIDPGSHWWEASRLTAFDRWLTAQPPQSRLIWRVCGSCEEGSRRVTSICERGGGGSDGAPDRRQANRSADRARRKLIASLPAAGQSGSARRSEYRELSSARLPPPPPQPRHVGTSRPSCGATSLSAADIRPPVEYNAKKLASITARGVRKVHWRGCNETVQPASELRLGINKQINKSEAGRDLPYVPRYFRIGRKHCLARGSNYSPPTYANWGRSRIFARGNRAGRCRWSAGFLGDLPVSSRLRIPAVLRTHLIGSQDVYRQTSGPAVELELMPECVAKFREIEERGKRPAEGKSATASISEGRGWQNRLLPQSLTNTDVPLRCLQEVMEITCIWDMEMAMGASGGQAPCMLHASNMRKSALLWAERTSNISHVVSRFCMLMLNAVLSQTVSGSGTEAVSSVSYFAVWSQNIKAYRDETVAYNANSSHTRHRNGVAHQQNPPGSPANRGTFAARSSQSDTESVPRASRSQSENRYAHTGTAAPFRLYWLIFSVIRHCIDCATFVTDWLSARGVSTTVAMLNTRGAAVAERLDCSLPNLAGFNPRPGHSRISASENRTGRCRWSAGFLRDVPSPPRPCIPALLHSRLISPSSALKTLVLRAVSTEHESCDVTTPRLLFGGQVGRWNAWTRVERRDEGGGGGGTDCVIGRGSSGRHRPGISILCGPQHVPLFPRTSPRCEPTPSGAQQPRYLEHTLQDERVKRFGRLSKGISPRHLGFWEFSSPVQMTHFITATNKQTMMSGVYIGLSSLACCQLNPRNTRGSSDEALGVRVSVAHIAPSLLDLDAQLHSPLNSEPMRVIEVIMEWHRNELAGEMGDPRENLSSNGIVRHDSHMRKFGVIQPGIEPASL